VFSVLRIPTDMKDEFILSCKGTSVSKRDNLSGAWQGSNTSHYEECSVRLVVTVAET
jgi:hypothetical protein